MGKTTCAAATALYCASEGRKTLVLSTDATPSLAHIFEAPPGNGPAPVAENLYFHEIGSAEVREMWDKKFGRDVYQVFSSFVDIGYAEFVEFMTSMLPGLNEEFIVDYIRELALSGEYEAIVWDTAPLGQTLALLETPSMLRQHLKTAPKIYARLKAGAHTRESILEIIGRWEALSALNTDFLRNGMDFNLVAIPEALAVNQLDAVFSELHRHCFTPGRLIINNVVQTADSDFLLQRAREQKQYLELIRGKYHDISLVLLPMFPYEIKGLTRLRQVAAILTGGG